MKQPDLLVTLQKMVYTSRNLPAMTFDWIWSNNFAWLAEQGEAPLILALKRYYFNDIELEKFEADWRQGLDKLVPASHTGTQAQESWHLHRLRATMENLRLPVPEVVSKIQDLFSSRLSQLKLKTDPLWDVPCRLWSKDLVTEAQAFLAVDEQRFSAELEAGTQYTMFRREMAEPEQFRTAGWSVGVVYSGKMGEVGMVEHGSFYFLSG